MLCQQIKEKTLFCGEIPPPVIPELQQKLADKAIIPDATTRLRYASHLAALGWFYLQKGMKDDPASLQPIYLRQPPIMQRKEKTIKK
jgi:tRNA A37 threonylcarbamoyladenosine modification protein TsaB